jgi:hypothetical protein
MAARYEAPADQRISAWVDLVHIHPRAVLDSVRLSAVTTDDVEVTVGVELGELRSGKPFP